MRKTHSILLSWFLLFYGLGLGRQKMPFLLCVGGVYYKAQILNPDVSFCLWWRKENHLAVTTATLWPHKKCH